MINYCKKNRLVADTANTLIMANSHGAQPTKRQTHLEVESLQFTMVQLVKHSDF